MVKQCDKCQRHVAIQQLPTKCMTLISSPWPFVQWGIDIVSPFSLGKGQVRFLVVAINYFTKLVEAKPLASITKEQVRKFIWSSIVCRFGIPHTLISDNGRQFDNRLFNQCCEELGIQYHFSAPTYPRANWQVEVTDRIIVNILKSKLDDKKESGTKNS